MSDSYRTEKESIAAARRIKRNSNGQIVYPRVVVKPPTLGDAHPLTRRDLSKLFQEIPLEYLYGLNRIELRGRLNNEIGRPFGQYSPTEKVITLFSLPYEWRFQSLKQGFRSSLLRFYPQIVDEDDSVIVRWPKPEIMSLWFYLDVFTHELGHHYRVQYRHKNGGLGRYKDEELVAELHAERFTNKLFEKARAKRN